MVELELLGLHGDGDRLILTDPDGQRYHLLVDDALRAAVRRDRPRRDQLRSGEEVVLRPRDIQVLVRAGADAEEVAEEAGLPVEHVRRYEGPVLAERAWVVQQARALRIGHESDAPQLGDLVVDRLAARGVPAASLEWDAVRAQGQPWEVSVTFVADDREHGARWRVDLSARSVHAVDDEARWLSETEVGPGPVSPRRRLTAVGAERRSWVYDREADSATPAEAQPETAESAPGPGNDDVTETLLAELAAQRGTRVQPDLDLDDDSAEPPLWGAHPAASRPEDARDAHVLPLRGPRVTSPDEAGEVGTTPALPAGDTPEVAEDGAETSPRALLTAGDALPSGEGVPSPEAVPSAEALPRAETLPNAEAVPSAEALPSPEPVRKARPRNVETARSAAEPGLDPEPTPRRGREVQPARETAPRARKNRRTNRRSVPSWDEIVFGARPE